MEKTNREGMTWPEWAYAARIPEPTGHTYCTSFFGSGHDHQASGYAPVYRKERAAWRAGEDPSEWLAVAPKTSRRAY